MELGGWLHISITHSTKLNQKLPAFTHNFRRKRRFLLDFSRFFQYLSVNKIEVKLHMDFLFLGYQTVSLGVSKPVFGWLILSFTLSCQQILQKSTQKSSDPKIQKSKFHENFQKLIFAFLEVGNSKYTLFKLFKHVLRRFWPCWEDLIFFHFWDIT